MTGVQCFRSAVGLCWAGKWTFSDVAENVTVDIFRVTESDCYWGRGSSPFIDLAGDVTLPHIARCQVFVKPFQQLLDSFTLNVGTAASSETSETLSSWHNPQI